MPCFRCGRVQEDPPQGKPSPWKRAVISGEQVLVCPVCQGEAPDWNRDAERCRRCGNPSLSLKLGMRVCSRCGEAWE